MRKLKFNQEKTIVQHFGKKKKAFKIKTLKGGKNKHGNN